MPRIDDIIILFNFLRNRAIYKNEINPKEYPLEWLLKLKFFKDITDEQIRNLRKYIVMADNKRVPITEKFEFSINNVKRPFEVRFIPFPEISCLLEFKEIDGLQSRLEGTEIELLSKGTLLDDLMEILKYVFQRNKDGDNPSYSDICEYMKITGRTCRKKIRVLIKFNYLSEIRTGRMKTLVLTEKGKKCLP